MIPLKGKSKSCYK